MDKYFSKALFLKAALLWLLLEGVGIVLAILCLLMLQPPTFEEPLQVIKGIFNTAIYIFKSTAISALIYAAIVIWFGFLPTRSRNFGLTLIFAGALAAIFTFGTVLVVYYFEDWNTFYGYLTGEPIFLFACISGAAVIASIIGVISTSLAKKIFTRLKLSSFNRVQ